MHRIKLIILAAVLPLFHLLHAVPPDVERMIQEDKYAEALARVEALLKEKPGDAELKKLRAELAAQVTAQPGGAGSIPEQHLKRFNDLLAAGNRAEASKVLDALAAFYPDDPRLAQFKARLDPNAGGATPGPKPEYHNPGYWLWKAEQSASLISDAAGRTAFLNSLAGGFARVGNLDTVRKLQAQAPIDTASEVEVRYSYATWLAEKGDLAGVMEKISALDQFHQSLVLGLAANALVKRGDLAEAHKLLAQQKEDNASIGHELLNHYARAGKPEEAFQVVAQMAPLKYEDAFWGNLGEQLAKAGNPGKADECFGQARKLILAKPPEGQDSPLLKLALSEAKAGRHELAAQDVLRAKTNLFNDLRSGAWYSEFGFGRYMTVQDLQEIFIRLGDKASLEKLNEELSASASKHSPKAPPSEFMWKHLHAADLYAELGRLPEAAREVEKIKAASSASPGNKDILTALASGYGIIGEFDKAASIVGPPFSAEKTLLEISREVMDFASFWAQRGKIEGLGRWIDSLTGTAVQPYAMLGAFKGLLEKARKERTQ